MRCDGRAADELRLVQIELAPIQHAEGSALVHMGKTRVLCAVSVEPRTPAWLRGQGRGWLTAEYALLPRATHTRTPRSHIQGGRAQEIRRLIGRVLRQAVCLDHLGEITLTVDCDVLVADGGTRTAAVNGGYVAVALALNKLIESGAIPPTALRPPIGAVSVGRIGETLLLDLAYEEDVQADMDLNVAMDAYGKFVEIQGTAEGEPISREHLGLLLDLASDGIRDLVASQREALACVGIEV